MHKIQYQKMDTPAALYDLVQPALAVHNYNTRYAANQIKLIKTCANRFQN